MSHTEQQFTDTFMKAMRVLEETDADKAVVYKSVFIDTNIPITEIVSLIQEKEIDCSERLFMEMNSILSKHCLFKN